MIQKVVKIKKCTFQILDTGEIIHTFVGISRKKTANAWFVASNSVRKKKYFSDSYYGDDPIKSLKDAEDYVKETRKNLIDKTGNVNKRALPDGTALPRGIRFKSQYNKKGDIYDHFLLSVCRTNVGSVCVGKRSTATIEDYHDALNKAKIKLQLAREKMDVTPHN